MRRTGPSPTRSTSTALATLAVVALVAGGCASGRRDAGAPRPRPSTTPTVPTSEAPTTTTSPTVRAAALQRALDAYVAEQPVPFSVAVVDVGSGARAEHLADRVVLSASLYKLFVARELLVRIDRGALDRSAVSGDRAHHSVGECIRLMIVISDNECGQAGLRMVGGGALDAALTRDGFSGTHLASPQRTTANDVARFLVRARDGTLLGAGHERAAAELYDLLRGQQVNDRLPLGLPASTPIAHKTGDRIGWAHDAGVVTGPAGDFVLVVLTGPWASPCCDADHPGPAEARAFGAIAGLARTVFAVESGDGA